MATTDRPKDPKDETPILHRPTVKSWITNLRIWYRWIFLDQQRSKPNVPQHNFVQDCFTEGKVRDLILCLTRPGDHPSQKWATRGAFPGGPS